MSQRRPEKYISRVLLLSLSCSLGLAPISLSHTTFILSYQPPILISIRSILSIQLHIKPTYQPSSYHLSSYHLSSYHLSSYHLPSYQANYLSSHLSSQLSIQANYPYKPTIHTNQLFIQINFSYKSIFHTNQLFIQANYPYKSTIHTSQLKYKPHIQANVLSIYINLFSYQPNFLSLQHPIIPIYRHQSIAINLSPPIYPYHIYHHQSIATIYRYQSIATNPSLPTYSYHLLPPT